MIITLVVSFAVLLILILDTRYKMKRRDRADYIKHGIKRLERYVNRED